MIGTPLRSPRYDERHEPGCLGAALAKGQDSMNGVKIAATRQLLGLSRGELAAILDVSAETLRGWEAEIRPPKPSALATLAGLRARHDAEAAQLVETALDGTPIIIPTEPMPEGWYLALTARVIDRDPEARIDRARHERA